jgi:hypothetical protein
LIPLSPTHDAPESGDTIKRTKPPPQNSEPEAPNNKHQINSNPVKRGTKLQTPKSQGPKHFAHLNLVIGICLEFGIWSLEFAPPEALKAISIKKAKVLPKTF